MLNTYTYIRAAKRFEMNKSKLDKGALAIAITTTISAAIAGILSIPIFLVLALAVGVIGCIMKQKVGNQ